MKPKQPNYKEIDTWMSDLAKRYILTVLKANMIAWMGLKIQNETYYEKLWWQWMRSSQGKRNKKKKCITTEILMILSTRKQAIPKNGTKYRTLTQILQRNTKMSFSLKSVESQKEWVS